MNKRTRQSEIRVTGADGVTHTGYGDGMAAAVRELGAEHDRLTAELLAVARTPGSTFEDARATCEGLSANEREASRWRLTAAGWAAVNQLKGAA